MHKDNLQAWQHDHVFNQNKKSSGESKTFIVVAITAVMMLVEIFVGIRSGSMALLADGLHMASHSCALGINLFAYSYARRHAHDLSFNFGTGKVNALGGFSGAILLAGFAGFMAWESCVRMVSPVSIIYNQAIIVAFVGLVVNGLSVFILQGDHEHSHDHDHHHEEHSHDEHDNHHHHDHNLRSAYLHVLADALTSLLAIFALFAAKYLNWTLMDPLMGIVGAVLVFKWSLGLLKTTSAVLLDRQGPEAIRNKIREQIESDGDSTVTDLHVWSIGPNIYSAIISLVAHHPKAPEFYKEKLRQDLKLAHVTIETNLCIDHQIDCTT